MLASILEMIMDNLIGGEEERYYFYLSDVCLHCLCNKDQQETTLAQQSQRRQRLP